jgi:hypothetical protein
MGNRDGGQRKLSAVFVFQIVLVVVLVLAIEIF